MAFDRRGRSVTPPSATGSRRATTSSGTGETYTWSKHHEFLKFVDLPRRRPASALRAVPQRRRRGGPPPLLEGSGWQRLEPAAGCRSTRSATRRSSARSRAEWTVAKDQNVRLQSGWFSERDACYLATGKPVIAQSTGFEQVPAHRRGALRLPHDGRRARGRRPRSRRTTRRPAAPRGPWPRSTLEATARLPAAPGGPRAVTQGRKFVIFNADDFGYSRGDQPRHRRGPRARRGHLRRR